MRMLPPQVNHCVTCARQEIGPFNPRVTRDHRTRSLT